VKRLLQTKQQRLQEQSEYRLVVDLPGITDVKKALDIIGKTPLLEFKTENPDYNPSKAKPLHYSKICW
jgi:preprotein translocase subunit SecD